MPPCMLTTAQTWMLPMLPRLPTDCGQSRHRVSVQGGLHHKPQTGAQTVSAKLGQAKAATLYPPLGARPPSLPSPRLLHLPQDHILYQVRRVDPWGSHSPRCNPQLFLWVPFRRQPEPGQPKLGMAAVLGTALVVQALARQTPFFHHHQQTVVGMAEVT